jgi:LysR family transcriptional regulator (chromosome initiation inhibitor)
MSLLHPQLAAFAAVLDEGSFEGAARRLSLTPSAISQRVRALEDRLGQVLVRRGSPCQATAAGRQLLRNVQQMRLLEAEALQDVARAPGGPRAIAIAVNADSLATWFLPALAALHAGHGLLFDVRVEDQDHSARLLRDGTVLGAVTADARPVQGCTVRRLGTMRYLPAASPGFVARHFPAGPDAASLGRAPLLVFNRKDALQERFIRRITRARLAPPRHYLPSPAAFLEAMALGMGWGMAPESMLRGPLARGELRAIGAGRLDVPLYWQHWSIRSAALAQLTAALRAAAAQGGLRAARAQS